MYQELADMACNRITAGITRALEGQRPINLDLLPTSPQAPFIVRNHAFRETDWTALNKIVEDLMGTYGHEGSQDVTNTVRAR